jgi:uncharacterized protein
VDSGSLPEPLSPTAPRASGRTIFTQEWRDIAFLHWAVDPDRLRPFLPPGTQPDVLNGRTYVGLIPFRMRNIGVGGTPGIPYFGTFPETNVRLYSVDDAGRRGVVFCSLEASRLAPVAVARALGIPYYWSRMRAQCQGGVWTYTSRRRWPGPRETTSRIVLRPGGHLTEVGEVERFVTARWGLHAAVRGRTVYWPNEHPEWPLQTAQLLELDDHLVTVAGFSDLTTDPPHSVLFSTGVTVKFGPRYRV